MEKHVTILGAFHVAVAALGLLAIPIVLLALAGTGSAALFEGQPGAFVLLSGLGAFISLAILAVSLPSLIAGIGLLKRRTWWRAAAGIASVFNLVNPPFGPLLAVYTLWILFRSDRDPVPSA